MKLVTRIMLKAELRKARRHGDSERVELCQAVLEDGDLHELVAAAAEAEYQYEQDLKAGGFGDAIRNALQWVFDHKEEILAAAKLLLTILAVFAAENEEAVS